VMTAEPVQKAPRRQATQEKLTAAAAAVQHVGLIRLSMYANLSAYDPTYSEYTIGALAPSSQIPFQAFRETVSVQFANAQQAQRWSVPAAEAQATQDRVGSKGLVYIDVLVRAKSVQPGSGGGVITGDVVEYELKNSQTGAILARKKVAP
jgi:hypothetical protein